MLKHKLSGLGITEKEYAALQAILDSEYGDGWGPDKCVWSWSANPFPNLRSSGGVFASLVKKMLVHAQGSGVEATLNMTDEGFRRWCLATYEDGSTIDTTPFSSAGSEILEETLFSAGLVLHSEEGEDVSVVITLEAHARLHEAMGDDEPDDSMDGDHASGLASAGFGVDEDCGDFGGDGDYDDF